MLSRRNFIGNSTMALPIMVVKNSTAFSMLHKGLQPKEQLIGYGGYKYKVDKNRSKISSKTNPVFNNHEMVQFSKGRLMVMGDDTRNNIVVFDKSGKLLHAWRTGWAGEPCITILKVGGDDFLLIADCGRYRNRTGNLKSRDAQFLKTDLNDCTIFPIMHSGAIGIYKDNKLFMPTTTALVPNGDIYEADGYGADYIIQYNGKDQYIQHFGGNNNANPEYNLSNEPRVDFDSRDKNKPALIITSRKEISFIIFFIEIKFIQRVNISGMYVCRAVPDGENIYSVVCRQIAAAANRYNNSDFVTILDDKNQIISKPGGNAPIYLNNVLQPTLQVPESLFKHFHEMCAEEDKDLYFYQWNATHTTSVKLTQV